jgi:hypothetical protein
MVVDSYLEMFTTLFGWMWYDSIWFVLRDSGLLFLPFVGMIVDHYIEYRKTAEDSDGSGQALRGLEVELILALFVIVLAGSPSVPLQATEVSYTPRAMFPGIDPDPERATPDESGVTFGGAAFSAFPDTVQVPYFWSLVMAMSSALNRAVMDAVPTTKSVRAYTEILRTASIDDPQLKQEVNEFSRDCFVKARSKYLRENPQSAAITALTDEYGTGDTSWPGSHIFLQTAGYYDSLRSSRTREPFLYSAVRDTEWDAADPDKPVYGRPTCEEWWTDAADGLKAKIIDSLGLMDAIAADIEVGWDEVKRHDAMIRNLLQNTPPAKWTPSGYDYAYKGNQGPYIGDEQIRESPLPNAFSFLKGTGVTVAAAWETTANEVSIGVLLAGSSQFQAILIMFIVAFLPFVLLIGRYDLGIIFMAAWALMVLKFFTVIWFLVWWLDQNLWLAMYPDPGMITSFQQLGEIDKRLLLNYLVKTMFYAAPLILITISGWGGYQVLGGLASLKNSMIGGLKNSGGKALSIGNKVLGKK